MPLSSAERFRIFKAKLRFEENKLLLQKFREKDAAAHRKSRQSNKNNPEKIAKIREQNRVRQAKRRLKLAAEKLGPHLNQSCSLSTPATSQISYKCVQTFAKAVHRTERGLPKSPTKQNEIIQYLAIKYGIISKPVPRSPPNILSDITKNNVIEFHQLNEISSVAPGKKDVIIIKSSDGSKIQT
jgi:hypothetical protein